MKLGYGQDALKRGFFAYEKDRKVDSVFVFDRANAEIDHSHGIKLSEPPNVRLWQRFLDIFQKLYEVDREAFFTEVFKENLSNERVVTTLAETLFGTKGSRLILARTLDDLLVHGLIPRPTPKAPHAASSPMSSPPPRPNRRSMGSTPEESINEDRDETLSKEAIQIVKYVEKLWDMTEEHAKRGAIGMLIFEEWLLNDALEDTDLREAFINQIDSPREFARILAQRWSNAVAPGGFTMPQVLKSHDAHFGLLSNDDARCMYSRFMFQVVGRQGAIYRKRRAQVVKDLRISWSSLQAFKPRQSESLIAHFIEAHKYNTGQVLVHARSLLANLQRKTEVGSSLDETAKIRRRESTFANQKKALTSKNEFDQTVLSHQTIFLLTMAKEIGEISDTKWLIVFSYILFAITGEVYDISEMKQICITGGSLVLRSRQLLWRLYQDIAIKINSAPGVKSVATDDTEINHTNAGSRAMSYFDTESNMPKIEIVGTSPTSRKTSEAGAEALARDFNKRSLNFVGVYGGASDNAPNAAKMINDFVDLCLKDVLKELKKTNNDVQEILVNGVSPVAVWVGSGTHILSLLSNEFRKKSFGEKTAMDEASGGQLPYKWGAVLRSDQRVSGRGVSVYQVNLKKIFGRPIGFWNNKITEENEARWGQSVQSRIELLRYIDYPMGLLPPANASLAPNALAAAAIFLRKRLKKSSWQIFALLQVAIWSCSPQIVFSIRAEVEMAGFFLRELAFLRSRPDRPYLSRFAPEFKMRIWVGRLHEFYVSFVKQMAQDPAALLPDCMARLPLMFDTDSERQEMTQRLKLGGLAQLALFKKHCSWIYEGLGIVLSINTPSVTGPVARALAQVIGDLMFPTENEIKANAMAAVEKHKHEDVDQFWFQLAQADASVVRQYALQFLIVGGDPSQVDSLSVEWLALCRLTSSAEDQAIIRDQFDKFVPLMHQRQLHYVDPNLTDTTMLEGLFSVERRKNDKSKTSARSDEEIFWDQSVIKRLREIGRSVGDQQRNASKSRRDSKVFGPSNKISDQQYSDWCSTYAQVHAILLKTREIFLPMFTQEKMSQAPKVRSLKVDQSYSSQDTKLAEEWATKLDADSALFHREVSCAELEEKGKKVKLTFKVDDTAVPAPMLKRLSHRYAKAGYKILEKELQCHLPLSLLAMRALSSRSWPESPLKILLATLLPHNIRGVDIDGCFRPDGLIFKDKSLSVLNIFLQNARLLLEFLGSHEDDVRDILSVSPQVSRFNKGAGSAGAFFIIGPFSIAHPTTLPWPGMWGEEEEEVESEIDKYEKYARIWHGKGDFQSIFVSEAASAADTALSI